MRGEHRPQSHVCRNAAGLIDSLHRERNADALEFLDDLHPDVQSFIRREPVTPEDFNRLDADFVRVIEDVIDTLIARNVINITDLPDQAQAKLFARKSFRDRAGRNALRLFEDSSIAEVVNDSQMGAAR